MLSDESVLEVIDALEKLQFPYMVVGSLASSYYGVPRSTKDVDIVIEVGSRSVSEIAQLLGPRFRFDPQMSFETVTMTFRYILEVEDTTFKIELFLLGDDPYDQERFRRRQRVEFSTRAIFLPTAEDVIVTKLRWLQQGQRSKDRIDIQGIIAVRGDKIDWPYVYYWCDRHGTRAALDEIRRAIPPI